MSEMLANQYFMTRKFADAQILFMSLLDEQSERLDLAKKLVICFTQTGEFSKALSLFHMIISTDIEVILSTDILLDDCPCPEIISKLEKSIEENDNEWEPIILGMLWLYCDIETSLMYFNKAAESHNYFQELESIVYILTHKINQFKSSGVN